MKCAAPTRQSISRCLTRKEAATRRWRLGIQPSRAQLAHRGVDERVAGAALLPGGDRVRVVPPDAATGMEIAPFQLGRGGEELGVEVAPAELPEQLLGGAAGDLRRRDRAEVEVGRERRRVGGAKRRARVDRRGKRPLAPGAPVRGEDAVVVLAGRRELAGRDDRDPGEEADLEALGQPGHAAPCVGAHVLAQVDGVRAEAGSLLDRVAVGDDEPERRPELGQPLAQEAVALRARRERAARRGRRAARPDRSRAWPPPARGGRGHVGRG